MTAFSRPGERAKPAPKQPRPILEHRKLLFEGQRQDRQTIADRVATYGLKVFCTDCGLQSRHHTGRGVRLRNVPSPCCRARMHPARWSGWEAWRVAPRDVRREDVAGVRDPRIERVGREYFMRGLDS